MDYSQNSTTPGAALPSRSRRQLLITALLLVIIVAIGAYFRTVNLSDWDGQTGQHPDERFMHYTVFGMEAPKDLRTYLTSSCANPVPLPRNPQDKPEDWSPSIDSGCSTLNPRNFTWSRSYVYGTFPTTLTRLVAEATHRTGVGEILIVGRSLSVISDLITLLATFFLAYTLYGRRAALLAAALYAGAVMPIQQSHFFTVDNFAVAFGTLALLFSTRLGQRGRWLDAILAGLSIGAAVASKINMAALVALVFVALLQLLWQRSQRSAEESTPADSTSQFVNLLIRASLLLFVTGIVTFLAFRIFQPDAFTGPNLWNIGLEERFRTRLDEARLTANGTIDLPSSHQWAARTPWLFPWQNIVLWGLGAPLGLVSWLAWAAAGWQMLTRRRLAHLVPWVWIALYFGWQGQQFVTTMRYFLPLYAPLCVFAGWGLVQIYESATQRRRARVYPVRPSIVYRWIRRLKRPAFAIGLLTCVLGATWAWAWAYTQIYTRPYTRVTAAEWIQRAEPNGTTTTWEWWDDLLPFKSGDQYQQKTTYPYAEDELEKYIGKSTDVNPGDDASIGLIEQLSRSDYVVLTSPRVYGSTVRVPQRFPATVRYYQALFDGSLGFQLVADVRSFPTLFGIPIPDLGAEEAFWVYDHPRVLIFRRTAEFSPERARLLMTQGINWDEVYRGLRPQQVNDAPTALQLTPSAWNKLQSIDTRYLFWEQSGLLGLLIWLLAIEVLGVATIGILWRLQLPLSDRGLSLARPIGLLIFASLPALLGALQIVSMSRWLLLGWFAVLLIAGGWLLWKQRRDLNAFMRAHSSGLLVGQVFYGLTLIAGVLLYRLGLTAPSSQVVARWTALVRTPTLPPYDPFFAGGHDPLAYTARLPFALLDKLLGLYPQTTLRYVLPTALALALLGVWSALYNSFEPRALLTARPQQEQGRSGLLALLGALLVALPGIVLNDVARITLWQALADWNAESIGLAALVATTVALAVGLLRPAAHQRLRNLVLLLLLPLVLLRGQGSWLFGASLAVVALLGWAGARGNVRRWALMCLTLLVGAIGIGHLFAWSLAKPLIQASEVAITPVALLLSLIAPLVLLFMVSRRIESVVADRGTLLAMSAFVVVWIALVSVLNWSLALLVAPLLMLFTWLAVQSWLPGLGARCWRLGALLGTAAIAMALLLIGSLMLAGRIAGDATQIVIVATVLLVIAAGWALPQLAVAVPRQESIPTRSLTRLISSAIGIAIIGIIVIGGLAIGQIQARRPQAEQATTPELTAALRWLAQTSPGTPVVATASQSATASAASATGLPTILTAIDEQRRVREVLQPSISGVIDGRQRALDDLYGGGVERARQIIQSYRISYVLVGPEEHQRFGENAGIALEVLAGNKAIKLAYDQNDIQIYSTTTSKDLPQFVAQKATLTPPTSKTLMLDQPVDELPVVNEYGWNTLASNVQPLGIGLWLALLEVLGLLAFPLTALIFRHWHDRGWGVSKIVGLVIWGYAVWLPVNLRWWSFNWWSLVFSAAVLALLSTAAYLRQRGGLSTLRANARLPLFPARGVLIRSELCFLIAFGIWTLVRAANPDVWHPFYGGEKPFEFGFLNAILRSSVLPPFDPFFSDGIINYYYYGLFLVGLPIKATGIDPAIGFNLALATLFALTATAALALGRQLTGRWRYGLFAILLLIGVGPFASIFAVTESKGIGPIIAALREGLPGFGGRVGAWFWGPSRVIPYTINEFPLFGFLFADLHPHLIALPITLLAMACAVELIQRRPRFADRAGSGALLALSALVIGALAIANSWDAPTYALVIGGALVGQSWRSGRGRGVSLYRLGQVARAIVVALAVTAAGLALYTPFFLHYQAMVGGIGRVKSGDRIAEYILLYGPVLFVGLTLLGCGIWLVTQRATATWRVAARGAVVTLPLLVAALLLSGWAIQNQPIFTAGWPLRILLGSMALTGVLLALIARLRDKEWLPLWLITVGLMVALGIQFIFIKDHLAGGDAQRMNTVFKFGQQIWALWAIGAATAMPLIIRRMRRFELALGLWYGILVALLLPGLLYPLVAIPSRLSTRFNTDDGITLDGLKFMQRATYTVDNDADAIELRFDGEAIAWIKQNIAGTPVFATSEAEFYRTYGMRIAANTGVPTVLGRLHQDEQRPGALVQARDQDVKTLFSTTDIPTALQILAKYHVDYVYVGPIERLLYAAPGAAKWEQMHGKSLDLVFRNDGVQIYKVKAETIAEIPVETPTQPPVVFDDPALRALEAEVASKPQDSAAAFGLGQRYVQANRPEDAVRVLSSAAQSNPNDVPLHHLLGDIQSQLGNADEAILAWQQAAEAQRSPQNLNKLAQGLIRFGRWQEAEDILNEALKLDPSFIDPLFYLGELYRSRNDSGDRERAADAYQRYLAVAPADAPWRALAEAHLRERQ